MFTMMQVLGVVMAAAGGALMGYGAYLYMLDRKRMERSVEETEQLVRDNEAFLRAVQADLMAMARRADVVSKD